MFRARAETDSNIYSRTDRTDKDKPDSADNDFISRLLVGADNSKSRK